jgi:hypothetical protein
MVLCAGRMQPPMLLDGFSYLESGHARDFAYQS